MADLIKKIKIKKQDDTYTSYIPIGADAENVDCSDGESVELKLNKIRERFEERPYIVTIGDSFGDPNAGGIAPLPIKWPVLVSNALNYRLINKCKSGCGFTYSEGSVPSGFNDNTFKSQLLQAEAQLGNTSSS